MKTYLLYNTESEWNAANAKAEEKMGIPTADGQTLRWDTASQVTKEGHSDFGKYIFTLCGRVCLDGTTLKNHFPKGQSLGDWFAPVDPT